MQIDSPGLVNGGVFFPSNFILSSCQTGLQLGAAGCINHTLFCSH